jgi:hypothetical protein
MTWFYLSFADANLPEGTQFLGGCYVQAPDIQSAIIRSHRMKINPGGAVQIAGPLSDREMDTHTSEADRHRLLTFEEIRRAGTEREALSTCTCGRPERGMKCRCVCDECGSRELGWKAWGSYLDRDLICVGCGHIQDIWNC